MNYTIKISENLEKKLQKIPKKILPLILRKIDSLSENPRPNNCKKLKGHQKAPLYRLRVGDYRIVYSIEDNLLIVLVIEVAHRKDVYRK